MSAGKLFIKKLLTFSVTLLMCSAVFALAALIILHGAAGSAVHSAKTDVYSPDGPEDVSVTVAVRDDGGTQLCVCAADISFESRSVAVTASPLFEPDSGDKAEKYIVFSLSYLSSFIDKCGGLFYNDTGALGFRDGAESRLINGAGAALLISASQTPDVAGVCLLRSFLSHFLTERYFSSFDACFTDIFQNCDTNVTYADWARISFALRDLSCSAIDFS